MGWKDWSDWAKGSIVSVVILVVILIVLSFAGFSVYSGLGKYFYGYPFKIADSVFCKSGFENIGCTIGLAFVMIPILIIIYSIIIGWIYGKIKNRMK